MTNTSGPVMKSKPRFEVRWNDATKAQAEGSEGLVVVKSLEELKKAGLKAGVIVSFIVYNEDGTLKSLRRTTVNQVMERIVALGGGA